MQKPLTLGHSPPPQSDQLLDWERIMANKSLGHWRCGCA